MKWANSLKCWRSGPASPGSPWVLCRVTDRTVYRLIHDSLGAGGFSGDDILNLPLLSVGAVGFVSVCGHTVGSGLREMLDAWFSGNAARALEIHQKYTKKRGHLKKMLLHL